MANRGPNTGGSQWFINVADNTYLDFDKKPLSSAHAVFGKVVEGMDVVDVISNVKADANDKPIENVTIKRIAISPKSK
jgi:peptidylprolyl isomerase